jgi:hypothetical protein
VAALAGIVAFTATAGLVDSMPLATSVAVAAAGAAIAWLRRSPAGAASIAAAPRWSRRAYAVGAALLLLQLVPLTAFVIDPYAAAWPARPWRVWISEHSCVSSYWMAATIIERRPDIYADDIYAVPQADQTARRRPRKLGPLNIDAYEYPPTFLPIPRLLASVTEDFWQFRRLWFALNLAGVTLCLVAVARRVDATLGTHATWLTPWVLAPPVIVGTLQVGNIQLLVIGAALAAMLLFERGRHATGGALLAYATASKLFPGILLLYLLLRRDWRAVGWTAVWAVVLLGLTLADVGTAPFVVFTEHLPRLLTGEAFPAFRNPNAIGVNESIPGLVFKIGLLGGPSLGFGAARVVGWIYTVVVVAATVWLARRRPSDGLEPLAWLVILILATMRSPFLPLYAAFPSLWLATLLAAVAWSRPTVRATAIAWWIVLALHLGQAYPPPVVQALWTFVHTVAAFALVGLTVRVLRQPATLPDSTAIHTAVPA